MKDLERVTLLFDFYGPLLTERQQEFLRAYFLEDLSLGEIAAQEQVSRQAVHDQIRRAEAALVEMEARTGLVAEHLQRREKLQLLHRTLQAALAAAAPQPEVALSLQLVEDLLAADGGSDR